jgi:hypothetical protein
MARDMRAHGATDRPTATRRRALLALVGAGTAVGGCLGGSEQSTPTRTATGGTPATTDDGTPATQSPGSTVRVADYGAPPDAGEDVTDAVLDAFAAASTDGATVVFEDGVYHLTASGDALFDLQGYSDLTIEGNGATLLPTNWAITFRPMQCSNLTIRNLTVDWHRDLPTLEGHVVDETADYVDIEPRDNTDPRADLPVDSFYPWDEANDRVAHPFHIQKTVADEHRTELLDDGTVRCPKKDGLPESLPVQGGPLQEGQAVVVRHIDYGGTGLRSFECDGLTLRNVTFNHVPGMGVYLKHTADFTAANVTIGPTNDRWLGCMSDGYHLKNAYGDYQLTDISIEGLGDDWLALPIFRHEVTAVDGRTLVATTGLSIRKDLEYHGFRPGDTVAIASTAEPFDPALTATIDAADMQTDLDGPDDGAGVGTLTLEVDTEIPASVMDAGTVQVYNRSHLPDSIVVDGATVRAIRGGTRLRSPNVTIRNSTIEDTSGALWFHGRPRGAKPDNGTIHDNTLRSLAYTYNSDWGVVVADPEATGLTVTDNTFGHERDAVDAIELRANDATIAGNDYSDMPASAPVRLGRNVDCATVTYDGEDGCSLPTIR